MPVTRIRERGCEVRLCSGQPVWHPREPPRIDAWGACPQDMKQPWARLPPTRSPLTPAMLPAPPRGPLNVSEIRMEAESGTLSPLPTSALAGEACLCLPALGPARRLLVPPPGPEPPQDTQQGPRASPCLLSWPAPKPAPAAPGKVAWAHCPCWETLRTATCPPGCGSGAHEPPAGAALPSPPTPPARRQVAVPPTDPLRASAWSPGPQAVLVRPGTHTGFHATRHLELPPCSPVPNTGNKLTRSSRFPHRPPPRPCSRSAVVPCLQETSRPFPLWAP